MRGRRHGIAAIGRAAGFAMAVAAIIAAAVQFRHDEAGAPAVAGAPSPASDPLAPELARCQAIGMAAKDDAACAAVWAENRRRFFADRPAPASPSAPPADPPAGPRPEDR
jgi:conjugative transfer region protein TrbK